MEWFRWYKSPDGHVNHFANNDEWYNKTVAQFIIERVLTKIGSIWSKEMCPLMTIGLGKQGLLRPM